MGRKFTHQMEKVLIELLKKAGKLLWDAKHPSHNDSAKRWQLYEKFGNHLTEVFNQTITAIEVKKKFVILRSSFNRESKRLKKRIAIGARNVKPRWIHYTALTFLKESNSGDENFDPLDNVVKETSSDCINFDEICSEVEIPTTEPEYENETNSPVEAIDTNETVLTDEIVTAIENLQTYRTVPTDETVGVVENIQTYETVPTPETISPVETVHETEILHINGTIPENATLHITDANNMQKYYIIEHATPVSQISKKTENDHIDDFFDFIKKSIKALPEKKRQIAMHKIHDALATQFIYFPDKKES